MVQQWMEFLFGTPKRFVQTICVSIALMLIVSQEFRDWLIWQLSDLVGRLIGPLLILAIIVYAFRRMLGPLFPSGGSKRH